MQTLRPASQVSNIGWGLNGGADYATILSDQSNTSYLSGTASIAAQATVALASGTDPGVDTGITVYARAKFVTETSDILVTLLQGASVIANGSLSLTSSFSDLSFALLEAEAANITDFTALRILVETGGSESAGTVQISEVWLEMPDYTPPSVDGTAQISTESAFAESRDRPSRQPVDRREIRAFQTINMETEANWEEIYRSEGEKDAP